MRPPIIEGPVAELPQKAPAPLLPIPPLSPPEPTIADAANAVIHRRRTPLERLYDAMANPKIPWSARIRAMGLAAEYVHAKQPQAIHVTTETRLEAVVVHVAAGPWMPETPHQGDADAPVFDDGKSVPSDAPSGGAGNAGDASAG